MKCINYFLHDSLAIVDSLACSTNKKELWGFSLLVLYNLNISQKELLSHGGVQCSSHYSSGTDELAARILQNYICVMMFC